MTKKEEALYLYLVARIHDLITPTFEEMADHLGHKSKATIYRMVVSLERQGRVERPWRGKQRRVRALVPNPLETVPSSLLWAELKRRGEAA